MAGSNGSANENGQSHRHQQNDIASVRDVKVFRVDSPNVEYIVSDAQGHDGKEIIKGIRSRYMYETSSVKRDEESGILQVKPRKDEYVFYTDVEGIPKRLGMMLVGLGGNNGSTVLGGIIANKHKLKWHSKEGVHEANWYGSLLQSGVVKLGDDIDTGAEVHVPFKDILPMVDPSHDIVVGGWDINNANMAIAMERAKVLEYDLQRQLKPYMEEIVPYKGIYDPSFIAANQFDRANHVMNSQMTKTELINEVRKDINRFKEENQCDKVIVLWTANTERFCEVRKGLNSNDAELMASIEKNDSEISPSTLYAVACILEKVPFINGSPQNTFVPGVIDLAVKYRSFIAGDDFKSGQTKMKSVLVDFLVGAGIKPTSIVSYNHLGNNDGYNLSEQKTFRSKEISKSNVVDDMVNNNEVLYPKQKDNFVKGTNNHIDHCVVIKYIPYVGDSKRALDEYTSEIFMNGKNTIVMHNTCEDSLLSAPIIVDMVILMELITRIQLKNLSDENADACGYRHLHPVATLLSYMAKAPLVDRKTPLINALSRQRSMIENFMKACVGLPSENNMLLRYK